MRFHPNWRTSFDPRSQSSRLRPEIPKFSINRDWEAKANPIPSPQEMFRASGNTPDPWQEHYLANPHDRQMVLACRRAGKSFATAVKTLHHCLTTPDALAMVFSPTLRQSVEFTRYVSSVDRCIGMPLKRISENRTELEWSNGSRLLSMPDNHEGVVGFTPTMIVIDEASRVSDLLYKSVRPMLALGGNFLAISTPFGNRGWFFDVFDNPTRLSRFRHYRVTADECPRISREFLEEEKLELGERWFRQEWYCSFEDAVDAVFSKSVIERCFVDDDVPLLFAD